MLICPECLRAFHMNRVEESTGVIENTVPFLPEYEQGHYSTSWSGHLRRIRVSCAPFQLSGWFQPSAALQATRLVAWRDESTKWTHPLRSEVSVMWRHAKQLSHRRCQEGR